jgi:hypothetical protein
MTEKCGLGTGRKLRLGPVTLVQLWRLDIPQHTSPDIRIRKLPRPYFFYFNQALQSRVVFETLNWQYMYGKSISNAEKIYEPFESQKPLR